MECIPAAGLPAHSRWAEDSQRTVSHTLALSPADGLKCTSQQAEVAITLPQGETAAGLMWRYCALALSQCLEPVTQTPRQPGRGVESFENFEKLHFSLTRGLAQVLWSLALRLVKAMLVKAADLPFAV